MHRALLSAAIIAGAAAFGPAMAQDEDRAAAHADVMDRDGNMVGTVTIEETASEIALVTVELSDIPEGIHGIHLHETGDCSADDFTSAGGHIPGDANHGVQDADGPHPGDLPNAVVGSDGTMDLEIFAHGLEIDDMILDDDGSSFVIHSGPDDYMSQPAGNSGDRIACGEFASD